MPKRGRRLASTREQREQVLRLVAEGESRRSVAREVFGDERLRGRVDRIVREADLGGNGPRIEEMLERLDEPPTDTTHVNDERPSLEDLAARYAHQLRQRLDDPKERVSAGELLAFARLELWIENKRRVEKLNELTRERGA
jgi:hypothetical protein